MGILDRHLRMADISTYRIDKAVTYADGMTRPHVRDIVEGRDGDCGPMRVVAISDSGLLMVRDESGRIFNAPCEWFRLNGKETA